MRQMMGRGVIDREKAISYFCYLLPDRLGVFLETLANEAIISSYFHEDGSPASEAT